MLKRWIGHDKAYTHIYRSTCYTSLKFNSQLAAQTCKSLEEHMYSMRKKKVPINGRSTDSPFPFASRSTSVQPPFKSRALSHFQTRVLIRIPVFRAIQTHVPVASFPGPTSQTIGKAGGGPGTFWHVTEVKLRRHRRRRTLA